MSRVSVFRTALVGLGLVMAGSLISHVVAQTGSLGVPSSPLQMSAEWDMYPAPAWNVIDMPRMDAQSCHVSHGVSLPCVHPFARPFRRESACCPPYWPRQYKVQPIYSVPNGNVPTYIRPYQFPNSTTKGMW